MAGTSKIESAEYADLSRVLKWFIVLRWVAVVGVAGAVFAARYVLDYGIPFIPILILTALLFAVNACYSYYFRSIKHNILTRSEMSAFFHFQTIFDYVILFLLVYFTGYVHNPFVYFFVFHTMLSSLIFPNRTVAVYVLSLSVIFVGTTAGIAMEVLPYFSLTQSREAAVDCMGELYLPTIGLVVTLVISAYLITSINERIAERGQRFELELDRYKSLDKAKSNFILQVTHELRGPLAALKGYHEMILKGITGEIPQRTSEMLDRADRRTRNLLNIIDEMIDFAYMKSEEDIDYAPSIIELSEFLHESADLYSTMAKQRSVELMLNIRPGLRMKVNRDLMNVIFGNLITNAIKYSRPGTRVVITAEIEADEYHFIVQDSGMGIEPEELDRIFEEFYRSRRAREVERDGTGLGLSIVQKAVNLLGGRIHVYSEVDHGTSFHLYFKIPETELSYGVKHGKEQDTDHRR